MRKSYQLLNVDVDVDRSLGYSPGNIRSRDAFRPIAHDNTWWTIIFDIGLSVQLFGSSLYL